MKKIIALFTAMAFALTLGVAAFAQEKGAAPAAPEKKMEEPAKKPTHKEKKKAKKEKKKAKKEAGKKEEAAPMAPAAPAGK